MGGGPVHMINQLVWGVDLVEEQCLASMGIPSQPYTAASPLVYLAENSINAKVTGRLEDDSFMEVGPSFHQAHHSQSRVGGVDVLLNQQKKRIVNPSPALCDLALPATSLVCQCTQDAPAESCCVQELEGPHGGDMPRGIMLY